MSDTGVDVVLVDNIKCHGAGLKDVENTAHVAAGEANESLLAVLCDFDPLYIRDVLEARQDLLGVERSEPEPSTPGLKGGNDLGQVVADQAEPDIVCELFNDASESVLGVGGHGVGFIQNDQLEARVEDGSCGGEVEDLATNHSNATVVRGVQLQHHRVELSEKGSRLFRCDDCDIFKR